MECLAGLVHGEAFLELLMLNTRSMLEAKFTCVGQDRDSGPGGGCWSRKAEQPLIIFAKLLHCFKIFLEQLTIRGNQWCRVNRTLLWV